ncbi:MAG: sensor histidine kinase, partial [Janthinobacterium lividum]
MVVVGTQDKLSLIMINIFIFTTLAFTIFILAFFLYRNKKASKKALNILSLQTNSINKKINSINQQKLAIEQSLESRTALLVDVSHELRSPLHGIVSLSETLSTKWGSIEDKDRHELVTSIFDASIKLTELMNNLLDFSKFNAGKMVFNFDRLNLIDFVDEAINYCKKIYLF